MNKVIKNYLYNLCYQVLVLMVPLITTPYISRVLGAKGIGTFSYTNSIVQYFILFGCVGLNLYGQREIAYVSHDIDKRSIVFFELIILRFFTISVSLVLYWNTLVQNITYGPIFFIMSIDILASMFDISWFFQGIEDFKKIVLRNFIVKITGVILIFLFVQSSEDLSKYVLCHSLTLILGNLSMWMYIPTFVHRVKLNSLKVFRHIKPTVILFFPQIASSIYTTLDKTMIGFLTSSEVEVAYYEQSQKIVKIVMTIVTSLGTVMMPRIANLYKTNETEIIRQYLNKSIKFTFFLSFPMMFGLIALSSNIVPWFFGNGYEKVIPNMMFISPVLICISFSNLMGVQYLLPLGRQKEFTISIVTGTILNVLINIILIPFLFSIGAAIATVVAEFGVSCVQLYYLRKDFNLLSIIKENVIYVFSSFVMFIPVYFISNALKSSIINSVFCCICGIVIYSLMLLIFGDKLLLRFIKKMLSKVMKT